MLEGRSEGEAPASLARVYVTPAVPTLPTREREEVSTELQPFQERLGEPDIGHAFAVREECRCDLLLIEWLAETDDVNKQRRILEILSRRLAAGYESPEIVGRALEQHNITSELLAQLDEQGETKRYATRWGALLATMVGKDEDRQRFLPDLSKAVNGITEILSSSHGSSFDRTLDFEQGSPRFFLQAVSRFLARGTPEVSTSLVHDMAEVLLRHRSDVPNLEAHGGEYPPGSLGTIVDPRLALLAIGDGAGAAITNLVAQLLQENDTGVTQALFGAEGGRALIASVAGKVWDQERHRVPSFPQQPDKALSYHPLPVLITLTRAGYTDIDCVTTTLKAIACAPTTPQQREEYLRTVLTEGEPTTMATAVAGLLLARTREGRFADDFLTTRSEEIRNEAEFQTFRKALHPLIFERLDQRSERGARRDEIRPDLGRLCSVLQIDS
ncbi:hypothetical protein MRY87_07015 [bacterium]|nr:hypothetical protein [bacterium]